MASPSGSQLPTSFMADVDLDNGHRELDSVQSDSPSRVPSAETLPSTSTVPGAPSSGAPSFVDLQHSRTTSISSRTQERRSESFRPHSSLRRRNPRREVCERYLSTADCVPEISAVIDTLHSQGVKDITIPQLQERMPQLGKAREDGKICRTCAETWLELQLDWYERQGLRKQESEFFNPEGRVKNQGVKTQHPSSHHPDSSWLELD